jgi:DNA-binding CsgD family transcriptional regulator
MAILRNPRNLLLWRKTDRPEVQQVPLPGRILTMLAIAEDYLRRIRAATNDDEILAILAHLAAELGFRSGYVIEYAPALKSAVLVLDSNPDRLGWWESYLSSGLRRSPAALSEMFALGGVQYVHIRNADELDNPMYDFAGQMDMLSSAIVPTSLDAATKGMVGFCGERVLSREQERAVQFVCHVLLAQIRQFQFTGIKVPGAHLTPREREVIALSSEGLTSQEVADQLGMSPRTVNQHMDNVADKLGTRNRVHSVAEAIRRDLL